MSFDKPLGSFFSCVVLLVTSTLLLADDVDPVDFDRDIQPILSDRCYFCHGPDAEKREADLRLDLEEAAKDQAIVPGSPEDSELIARITSDDEDERMPPAGSKLSLSKNEIDLIRKWIAEGAPWKQHWSFVAPKEIEVPKAEDSAWPRNEIDQFVYRRLKAAKLKPSPPASRETWIRRVTFDLTGLPPTLEEIDAFLADDSSEAYERVVDRLLRSESFGERMAATWLDVARYSDTYGYQVDRDRFVWPWRDWVIRAFNENLPYDQFITQQLAGDLLPNATDDQILATTFNRLHPQKVEGGSTPEEFRIEYVADRTQTFATGLLGLTMECCRCHDHKYDPLTQEEYYQISAFFDNIDEAGLYSYFTPSVPTPTLLLQDEAAKAKLAKVETDIADSEMTLRKVAAQRRDEFLQWLKSEPKATILGEVAHLDFEKPPGGNNKSVPGKQGNAVKLTGDDAVNTKVGNFHQYDPFSVSLWINTPDIKERAVVFHRSRAWTDAGSRGYQLLIEEGKLSASLIHFWPGNAIRVKTRETIPVDQWQHVVVTWDGSSRASGLRIFLNGTPAETEVVRDNLYKEITGGGGDHIAIGERFRDRGFTNGLVDEFRVYNRQLTDLEVAQLHDGKSLDEALTSATERITKDADDAKDDQLYQLYLATADSEYQQQLARLKALRQSRVNLLTGTQEIMVMRELPEPRQTYLLKRGAYDARQKEVSAATPASLPEFPADAPRNRLGLAKWLTDPGHPLTARVAVNRFWQAMLGQGLVRTPEDFGRQGQAPTHPLLLDWLARDFVEHGWDVKRLLRQIVLSATYRQSSAVTKELLARDPENRLLARSSAYRLPAEMLRDNALAVSGLLVRRVGGAPAMPYELEASFKPRPRGKGDSLYRRSLYTYWKRTGPAPMMMTLDASKRDVCRVQRERTSTPLQVFVLMNGPQFVEAARVLSQNLLLKHGADEVNNVLVDLFRTLTSRQPSEKEVLVLDKLYKKQLQFFQENRGQADGYLKTGDSPVNKDCDPTILAAVTSVANALLSFDEVVTKR